MSDLGQPLARPARPKAAHRLAKATNESSSAGGQPLERGQPMERGQALERGQPMERGQALERGQPMERGQALERGQPMQRGQALERGQPMERGQALERRMPPQTYTGRASTDSAQPIHRRTAIDGTPGMRGQILRPNSSEAERESARGLKGQSKAEEAPQSLGQELQRRGQGLARDLSSRQPPPSTPSAGQELQRQQLQRGLPAATGQQLQRGMPTAPTRAAQFQRMGQRPAPASTPEPVEASPAPDKGGQVLRRELMRPQTHTSDDVNKQAMAMGGQLMMRAAAGQQMKLPSKPGAAQPAAATVTLDTFLHNFSVPKLMDKIADLEQHNLRAKIAAMSRPQNQQPGQQQKSASAVAFVQDLQLVDKLLVSFQRAEKEMAELERMVTQKVQSLHERVKQKEDAFREEVLGMEGGLAEAQAAFAMLDAQMSRESQTAAKIGDRLHNAEGFRKRALEGIKVITYLQEFANVGSLSELPELFRDDNRLAEAAAVTRQIMGIGQELTYARERVALLDDAPKSNGTIAPSRGSIEQAVAQVEAFRGSLEHRVIARFDDAVSAGDLGGMAECARIMAEFRQGESQLVQRYISTRPMFIDVRELSAGASAGSVTDAAAAGIALRDLSQQYKGLLAAVKEEALIMEQVFPSPRSALAIFVQRVFEQRVQAAVDRMLAAPASSASAEAQQQHLKLLVEVYKRTQLLAEQLQEVVGEGNDVLQMSEGVFVEHLADYPDMELSWLQQLYESSTREAEGTTLNSVMNSMLMPSLSGLTKKLPDKGVSPELVLQFLAWNGEAAARCGVLSPAGAAPANVRSLFHSSTVHRANSGCLLEQVASHLISGLSAAVEGCVRASSVSYGSHSIGPPSRVAVAKAAYTRATDGVGRVLEAVGAASGIIRALQQHYVTVIEPRVEDSPTEATACATGLAALVRAVERQVLTALQAALSAFFSQADRTLVAEQGKTDFRPPEDGEPPPLDRPTDACTLVAALLSALLRLAAQHLQASNLASFDTEVGRRAHAMLLTHMQRFTYSAMGALRWKRDVTEYADVLRNSHSPTTNAQMEELAALVNILLVAPDSLIGLVQTSLHMPHRQALTYIRLREDFAVAKVDGVPLARLFSHE